MAKTVLTLLLPVMIPACPGWRRASKHAHTILGTCVVYSGHSVNGSKSVTLVAELVQVECVESSV